MNPTKFGSPKLDNPSSRYNFLKFVNISRKSIKEKQNRVKMLGTPNNQPTPCDYHWAPRSTDPTHQLTEVEVAL